MRLFFALAVAILDLAAAPAPTGTWRVLVKRNAKWILKDKSNPPSQIVVETYDVRRIGAAEVARLRWTLVQGKHKSEIGDSDAGRYTQLAVTEKGLYLLSADQDDASVAAAIKKKPSRSDPPKPYKGTRQNEGRYLELREAHGAPIVCMGVGPVPGAGDCQQDVCEGELCVSPQAGVVRLEGMWAPDAGLFVQDRFEY
jgi:hypothetical protein